MRAVHWLALLWLIIGAVAPENVVITRHNVDQVLNSATVVFVAFGADWCPFSRRLKPVWDEAAREFKQKHPDLSAVFATPEIINKYRVHKYPTMRYFIAGAMHREYRGARTSQALVEHVRAKFDPPMETFDSLEALDIGLAQNKRNVIVYSHDRDSYSFGNAVKLAMTLGGYDCRFWASAPDLPYLTKPGREGSLVYFQGANQEREEYPGTLDNFGHAKQWLKERCIPAVRELTFENVEEVTEERLPLIVLFRDRADAKNTELFISVVARELGEDRTINPLLADAKVFSHPLHMLRKSEKDLPVLVIDSMEHVFLFDDPSTSWDSPGRLKQFVDDLKSGKLHRDFHQRHNFPPIGARKMEEQQQQQQPEKPPAPAVALKLPDSVFKPLKPSEMRYTLLKTEL
ncbi:unnamed protein product, partial [Mesorhabditis spiculigera]